MNLPPRLPAEAVPMPPSPQSAAPRLTPAEWDALRLSFHGSPLVEVSLASLAQNIDGCAWPVDAPDEHPSAYVDLSYGEALARLRSLGQPPARLDTLATILRGTLAFDESFGAMAAVASGAEAAADPVRRNLGRLGIPAEFPVAFCAFTPGTRKFCELEGLLTLGDFLDFSRGASRSVIVGGEFRDLLNAVSHIDEETLARYLPFRQRTSGLYLVEALGHLVRPLGVEERLALARQPASAPADLRAEAARRVEYFSEQATKLRTALTQGVSCSRLVVSLEDLSLEAGVSGLLTLYLATPPATDTAPASKPASRWRPRWWPRRD